MELTITWNPDQGEWTVRDANGKDLWSGNKYVDAAQFAEDYKQQQALAARNLLTNLTTAAVRD